VTVGVIHVDPVVVEEGGILPVQRLVPPIAVDAFEVIVEDREGDPKAPFPWDSEVKEIKGKDRVEEIVVVNNKTNDTQVLKVAGVFIAIGYIPAVELAEKKRF